MAIETQVFSQTLDLSANGNATALDVSYYRTVSAQLECASVTGATKDGTLQCQGSNDGTNWTNAGTAVTVNAATVHGFVSDLNTNGEFMWRYLRVNYTKNNTTGGTLTASIFVKR